jgi:hypothetical protein
MPVGQVSGFELGPVLRVKHGLILSYDQQSDDAAVGYLHFAVLNMARKAEDLREALGWNRSRG